MERVNGEEGISLYGMRWKAEWDHQIYPPVPLADGHESRIIQIFQPPFISLDNLTTWITTMVVFDPITVRYKINHQGHPRVVEYAFSSVKESRQAGAKYGEEWTTKALLIYADNPCEGEMVE